MSSRWDPSFHFWEVQGLTHTQGAGLFGQGACGGLRNRVCISLETVETCWSSKQDAKQIRFRGEKLGET